MCMAIWLDVNHCLCCLHCFLQVTSSELNLLKVEKNIKFEYIIDDLGSNNQKEVRELIALKAGTSFMFIRN